jgi:polyisoprenoid-binding protein YceI
VDDPQSILGIAQGSEQTPDSVKPEVARLRSVLFVIDSTKPELDPFFVGQPWPRRRLYRKMIARLGFGHLLLVRTGLNARREGFRPLARSLGTIVCNVPNRKEESMKARKVVSIAATLLLFSLVPAAVQAGDTFKVDSVHSTIFFKVKHFGVGYVYGRFNQFSGTFAFDDANPAESSFSVEVKTDSVDSNQAGRDKHLKGPDFFNVKEFPAVTFKSTGVKKIDDQNYEVTGDLTLLGVTKPITAKVERVGTAAGPRGGQVSGFEAVFTVNRLDFGMKFMSKELGEEVKITAALEGKH